MPQHSDPPISNNSPGWGRVLHVAAQVQAGVYTVVQGEQVVHIRLHRAPTVWVATLQGGSAISKAQPILRGGAQGGGERHSQVVVPSA